MKKIIFASAILLLNSVSVFGLESQDLEKNWAGALHQSVVSAVQASPELSNLEAQIYSALMDVQVLADQPDIDQQIRLKSMLSSLSREDSYSDFLGIIESSAPFVDFMRRAELISFAPLTCVCRSTSHCSTGYECDAGVSCTSEEGTIHNGVCKKKGRDEFLPIFEAFPLIPNAQ